MSPLNWEELQANPRLLLDRIKLGEPLTLVHEGRTVAEVHPVAVPPTAAGQRRPHGLAAGQITIADDFDAPLPDDVLAAFEGR